MVCGYLLIYFDNFNNVRASCRPFVLVLGCGCAK